MMPYTVMEVGRGAVDHLIRSHYLHSWPGVVVSTLALLDRDVPIGVLVFALPPIQTAVRYGGKTWELARLFIEDTTPKNTESWFIARAIKWIRLNHPDVLSLVSYADPTQNHKGTIYKAGNWIGDGRTDQERRTPRFDYGVAAIDRMIVYSRRSHVPAGAEIVRIPRVSKLRFVYWLDGRHEERRRQVALAGEA